MKKEGRKLSKIISNCSRLEEEEEEEGWALV